MKIVIFTLALVFLAVGQANPDKKELIKKINKLESEVKLILHEITSIKGKELPNLSQKILKLAESNKLVIQAKEELKKHSGKPSAKKCQALLNANLKSVVDQITVQVKNSLNVELAKIEKDLKNIDAKLDKLKKQLGHHHHHDLDKIEKEINEAAKTINNLKKKVHTLVPTALNNVQKNTLPKLAQENILKPVIECLKKH